MHVGLLSFEDLIPTPMKTSAPILRKQTGESIPSFDRTCAKSRAGHSIQTLASQSTMQGKIFKAIVLILGALLVAPLIFDAAQTSNPSSYIKAATAVLVTFTILLALKKKSATDLEAVSIRHRNIKMWIIGLAIGILLPIIFLWFITSIVK